MYCMYEIPVLEILMTDLTPPHTLHVLRCDVLIIDIPSYFI